MSNVNTILTGGQFLEGGLASLGSGQLARGAVSRQRDTPRQEWRSHCARPRPQREQRQGSEIFSFLHSSK